MENDPNKYEPGTDQNQGVVGTMARNQQQSETEPENAQMPDLDPNVVTNQDENGPKNEGAESTTDELGERKFINDEGVE